MNQESPIRPEGVWSGPLAALKRMVSVVFRVWTRPQEFFAQLSRDEPVSVALSAALVTHWIGSLGNAFFTNEQQELYDTMDTYFSSSISTSSQSIGDFFREMMQYQEQFRWGALALDPFHTFISLAVGAFFYWVAVKMFSPSNFRYSEGLKVFSYASTSAIFTAIPWAGRTIGWFLFLFLLLIGTRDYFRMSLARATTIVLLPLLVTMTLLFGFLALILFGVFQLFRMGM